MKNRLSDKLEWKQNWPGYMLLAPAVFAVIIVSIYPLFRGIAMSFTNYNLVRPNSDVFGTFAGFSNFEKIFTNDIFLKALYNTFRWVIVNLAAQLVFAMLLALALNENLRARGVFRTLTLVPWAVPHAIAAMTFTFLFNANVGIVNILVVKFGLLPEAISWLGNIETAFPSVAFVAIWKGIPFQMIFILASLQSIPGDVYESAQIDGANGWQSFWKITLPMIKQPLAVATVLNLIGILSCFNTIWLMTVGGPLYSTEILYTFAYREAFITHNMGTAAAASVILFLFTTLISVVYLKLSQDR